MSDFFGLFSGSSSSSSSDSFGINLADYASIKNGSYHKLLKATYANQEKNDTASSSRADADTKQKLNSISEAASDLKDSTSAIKSLFETKKDEKGNNYVDYDEDKMYKAIKDFVNDYNNTIEAASNSDTNRVLRAAKNMVSYTAANKNALSEIGITVGADNKLSIDEDDFKSASKAQVQSLFQSTGGYANQINAKASNIRIYSSNAAKEIDASRTDKSSNQAFLNSIATSADSSKTLGSIQDAAEDAKKSLLTLLESGSKSPFNKVSQKDENGISHMDYDRDSIYQAVKDFVKDYNDLLKQTEDTNTQSIKQERKTLTNYAAANKSAFSAIGITVDSDGSLSISENKFKNADMKKAEDLFQNRNSFGRMALQQIEKINSSAEKEAAKSNTYSNTGSYTNNYNSGDWYNSTI